MIMAMVILFGLVMGSFLNVLVDRLPRGENVVWKPSHCDFCKKPLRWFELIPVVSYLMQMGRCRRCRKRLSVQYPATELVTATGFVLLYLRFAPMWGLYAAALAVFSMCLVIFMIDWKHQIIPDEMLWGLLAVVLLLGIFEPPAVRLVHVLSGVASGFAFWLLWVGTRGRGLGFGDVKLVTVLGLFLGYPLTVVSLYAAFLTGAIWGVILMMTHRARMKSRIAFGPFLLFGAAVGFFWGNALWAVWQALMA